MDEKLIMKLIAENRHTSGANAGKADNGTIIKKYKEITGENLKSSTLRRLITKANFENERSIKPKVGKKNFEVLENGNVRLVDYAKMNEKQAKDPKFVMEAFGYDSTQWRIVSYTANEWVTSNSDEKELYNYQFKLTLAPKTSKDLDKGDIDKIVNEFKYRAKPKFVKYIPQAKTAEINFADMHIGSFELDIDTLYQQVYEARWTSANEEVEKVVIHFIGDILHVDNQKEQTKKGTQLKLKSTPYEMINDAIDIVMFIVEELSITETDVYWVEGNHSGLPEYTLFQLVKMAFKGYDNIRFFVNEDLRKAHLIYDTLIGLHHGDMPKKNQMDWLMFEYPELWGKAVRWEQRSGHTHPEAMLRRGGLIDRSVKAQKSKDNYEYQMGYSGDSTEVTIYIHEKGKGIKTIKYI